MFSAAVFTDCECITDVAAELDHVNDVSEESGDRNDDEFTNLTAEGSGHFVFPESKGMES